VVTEFALSADPSWYFLTAKRLTTDGIGKS